jgi:hypothetical protein
MGGWSLMSLRMTVSVPVVLCGGVPLSLSTITSLYVSSLYANKTQSPNYTFLQGGEYRVENISENSIRRLKNL